ncbi:hypothetical protein AB0M43_00335 [Longispora sp. NPDC051575]|uniref:hypothetical protein n=1 Tax=Longispora sp. NPDC051575 TaxID=3154943 RepID=UPI0034393356
MSTTDDEQPPPHTDVAGPERDRPTGAGLFAGTLDRAIEVRGCSLNQLRDQLASAGVEVSVSTLSMWRRGTRRPERRRSLQALATLDGLLGLPPGSLTALLGTTPHRGRFIGQPPDMGFSRLHDSRDLLGEFDVDARPDDLNPHMVRLRIRDTYEFNANGAESRLLVRHVTRAAAPTDRWLMAHQADDPTRPDATLRAGPGCRLGRIRTDRGAGTRIAELLFDRVARPGEVVLFDTELTFGPGGNPEQRVARILGTTTGLYVGQVTFHPHAVPERCHQYYQPSADAPVQVLREITIDATRTATMAVQGAAPGLHGMFWEWG